MTLFGLLLQKLQEQTFVIHELILVNTEEALWNEAVRKYPIEQIRKELPFPSRIFHMTRENFDHGGARNMGAGYSEADILIFMTQDAVPADKRLVEHLVACAHIRCRRSWNFCKGGGCGRVCKAAPAGGLRHYRALYQTV